MKAFCIFILFFILYGSCAAQFNQLVLRKNGVPHKRYTEGSIITIRTKLGMDYTGTIYLIQKDSIYFGTTGVHKNDIVAVLKKPLSRQSIIPVDGKTFLLFHAGIPLFVTGLVISGERFSTSLISGIGIVYFPIILYNMKRLFTNHRRLYVLGSKYDLQVLDLYPAEIVPVKGP
jgi:hypothetical protein